MPCPARAIWVVNSCHWRATAGGRSKAPRLLPYWRSRSANSAGDVALSRRSSSTPNPRSPRRRARPTNPSWLASVRSTSALTLLSTSTETCAVSPLSWLPVSPAPNNAVRLPASASLTPARSALGSTSRRRSSSGTPAARRSPSQGPRTTAGRPATPKASRSMPNRPPAPSSPDTTPVIAPQRSSDVVALRMCDATWSVARSMLSHSLDARSNSLTFLRCSVAARRAISFCVRIAAAMASKPTRFFWTSLPACAHMPGALAKVAVYLSYSAANARNLSSFLISTSTMLRTAT